MECITVGFGLHGQSQADAKVWRKRQETMAADEMQVDALPLMMVFMSHLLGSMLCRATRSSSGVNGDT